MDTECRARSATCAVAADVETSHAALGIEAMNALGTGISLLDRCGHVLFANVTAERLQERRTIFAKSPPLPLTLADPASNDALHRAIADACRNRSAALQLFDRYARPSVSAVVLPMCASQAIGSGIHPVALLAMNELSRPRSIPSHWLSQLFGLTPAEACVTNWLVGGRTIDEYAQHRGVSVATARSQLKAVLSKTGVSRQVQLVAALARLPCEHAST